MAKNNFGAGIRFGVVGFDKSVKQFAKIQNSFFAIKNAANLADKAFQGLTSTFRAATAAGKFEEGITAVGLVTRATAKDLVLLKKTAIDAALATQFSPQEAVEGLKLLSTAGLSLHESMKVLKPVLDLAAGSLGQLGLAKSAKAVAGALNAFRLDASKATEVTDKFLRVTQLTNFQANDLGASFGKASAIMNKYGQSLDETLILTGLLKNLNLDASSATTAVRNAILRLGGDQKIQNLVMSKGVKIIDKTTGKMRPLIAIIQDMSIATKSMGKLQKQAFSKKVFGFRGILAEAAVTNAKFVKTLKDGRSVTLRGAAAIKELRAEMAKSAGTASLFRNKMLATFEGQKKLLEGVVQSIAVLVGQPLVAVFKPFVKAIVILGGIFARMLRAIPAPVKKVIAALVVITLVFGTFLAAIVSAKIIFAGFFVILAALNITLVGVVATMALLSLAFITIGAVVGGLFFAFKSNFGGIAEVLHNFKMLVEGIVVVTKNWVDGTSSMPLELASALKEAGLLEMAIKIGGFFGRTIQFIKDLVSVAKSSGGAIKQATAPFLNSLLKLGSAVWSLFSNLFTAVFGKQAINGLKGTRKVGDELESTFNNILSVVNTVAKALKVPIDIITNVVNFLATGGIGKTATTITTAFSNGIKTVWSWALKVWSVIKMIGAVLQHIGSIFMPIIRVVWGVILDTLTAAWGIVTAIVGGFIEGIGGSQALKDIWIILQPILSFVWEVVKGMVRTTMILAAVFWKVSVFVFKHLSPHILIVFQILSKIANITVAIIAPVFRAMAFTTGFLISLWLKFFKIIVLIGDAIKKHLQGPIDFVKKSLASLSFGLIKGETSATINKNVTVSNALGGSSKAPILPSAKQASLPNLPSFPAGGLTPGFATSQNKSNKEFLAAFEKYKASQDAAANANKDLQRSVDANTQASQTVSKLLSNPFNTQAILTQAITNGLEQAQVNRGGRL